MNSEDTLAFAVDKSKQFPAAVLVTGKAGACSGSLMKIDGAVYICGSIKELSDNIELRDLTEEDKTSLRDGIPQFLKAVKKESYLEKLSNFSQWKKIIAPTFDQQLPKPEWQNAKLRPPCRSNCPSDIPIAERLNLLRQGKYEEALQVISEFSPFPDSVCNTTCPNPCMEECPRADIDFSIEIGKLGGLSKNLLPAKPGQKTGKKVAIIGGGPGGLTAAWRLRKAGHEVVLYEADKQLGGKFRQGVPLDRLPRVIVNTEIAKILSLKFELKLNTKVDKKLFNKLYQEFDAVVIANGIQTTRMPKIYGIEKYGKAGFDFLKKINSGCKPKVGKSVVIIGAGNTALDVAVETLKYGAKEVTCIDIQKPQCFAKEMNRVQELGIKILFPVQVEKVTAENVYLSSGKIISADTIFVAIGEDPDFSFLPKNFIDGKTGFLKADKFGRTHDPKIFGIGDCVKPALFADAVGMGNLSGFMIDFMLQGKQFNPGPRPAIEKEKLHTQYFLKVNENKSGFKPEDEYKRCISCGVCRDCYVCLELCPREAISRKDKADGSFEYVLDSEKCDGCGLCIGICPSGIWQYLPRGG